MSELKKRVDESWKEQAEREKQAATQKTPAPGPQQAKQSADPAEPTHTHEAAVSAEPPSREELAGEEGMPQARFDLFVSGLAMEALIALGEMPHPVTRRKSLNLPQARYLVDLLGVLEAKTKGNLTADEELMLKDTLYQLRMRYLSRAGAPATG